MMIEYVNDISTAPGAIGPYSQAVVAGSLLFISGQIAIDPATKEIRRGSIEEETEQVLTNLRSILGHFSLTFADVAKTTIFLKDMSDFESVNKIYATFLGEAKPSRATVAVSGLPKDVRIEIEMVAVLGK